jgi:hypothetical protein
MTEAAAQRLSVDAANESSGDFRLLQGVEGNIGREGDRFIGNSRLHEVSRAEIELPADRKAAPGDREMNGQKRYESPDGNADQAHNYQ